MLFKYLHSYWLDQILTYSCHLKKKKKGNNNNNNKQASPAGSVQLEIQFMYYRGDKIIQNQLVMYKKNYYNFDGMVMYKKNWNIRMEDANVKSKQREAFCIARVIQE